jgi:F-type H+-transporting ATPase subunit delta
MKSNTAASWINSFKTFTPQIMKNHKAVKRYTKALFELGQEQNQLEKIHSDFEIILALIQQSDAFNGFLKNPLIPVHKQQEILRAMFHERLKSLTYTFVLFLAEKKKLSYLAPIAEYFKKLYLAKKEILPVKLISAFSMSASQINTLCEKLKEYFHKDIEPSLGIDQSLLGGFKIQIRDVIYDLSLRAQLEQFRKSVMTV